MVVAAYVGLPSFRDHADIQDVPITVEIVNVSDVTNLPTKAKEPEPKKEVTKAEPKPPPKPPAPPPAPKGSVEQPPEPEPIPEPKEEVAVIVNPEPAPKKVEKPKPKPKEKPKKVVTKKRAPTPIPPRKPKAPDQFASVLKTLEELKVEPPKKKKEEEKKKAKPQKDFASMMENALESDKVRTDIGPQLSISEIDLVRQQIIPCWNLPSGAKDAHKMIIAIRMVMNPDGTVQQARILEQSRMSSDPFYRTMAESALRAALNPRCQPFKLPPEKYQRWKTMKLTFDPRDMLGL